MENQIFFFTIFVSLLFFILIETWRRSKTIKDLPPGPRKLPIIGNIHQLVGSLPHHRLTDLAKKYGPIMHLQLGQLSTVVISSPELAKEVLKTHDLIFASRPLSLAASVIVYNATDVVFSPYGDRWRQLKKICTSELLNTNRVQSFRSIREEEVSSLIKSIASNASAPVNLTKMLIALSYCIISRSTFSKVLQKQKEAFTSIVKKLVCALGGFSTADLFPSVKLLQVITGTRRKFQKLHQEADAILEDIIREHRGRIKSENIEAGDLVHALLNIQDRGMLDIPLKVQEIKAIILDMFIAGIETSANIIEWAIAEMVKHPEILEKAQAEVRRVFNGKEKVDERSLHDLIYLNLVIKETLRLHPPGPLIPRESRESANICGYKIPEKTRIMINVRAIGRDPYHWSEPEKFSPERFLNSSIDYKGTNFELLPFGAGRRLCPGILYGMSIVELVLANLLYHFDWKVPNEAKPEDLDMSEVFGIGIRRKNDLCLIPIRFNPLRSNKSQ